MDPTLNDPLNFAAWYSEQAADTPEDRVAAAQRVSAERGAGEAASRAMAQGKSPIEAAKKSVVDKLKSNQIKLPDAERLLGGGEGEAK